jgi:hypothetical protein
LKVIAKRTASTPMPSEVARETASDVIFTFELRVKLLRNEFPRAARPAGDASADRKEAVNSRAAVSSASSATSFVAAISGERTALAPGANSRA